MNRQRDCLEKCTRSDQLVKSCHSEFEQKSRPNEEFSRKFWSDFPTLGLGQIELRLDQLRSIVRDFRLQLVSHPYMSECIASAHSGLSSQLQRHRILPGRKREDKQGPQGRYYKDLLVWEVRSALDGPGMDRIN